MFTFSSSFMFDFELTRILGSASSGGCDVGELKSAVGKIKKHDAESWHAAWKEQGERAERIGDDAAKAGFKVPARNAYLPAVEKKTKKPKATKNLDSKKKGTGLTPEQAKALQSELLASSSGASASASLGALPEPTNNLGQHADPLGPVDQSANATSTASTAATASPMATTSAGPASARLSVTSASAQHRRARLARYVPRIPAAVPGSNTDRLARALGSKRAERQGSASLCEADHRALRASYREDKVCGRSASPAVDSARNVGREMEVRQWEWY